MKHYRGRMTYGDYLVSLPWWHAPAIWVRRARRLVSDFLAEWRGYRNQRRTVPPT